MTFQNNNQLYIKNTSKSKYQLNFYLFNKKIQIDLHQLTNKKTCILYTTYSTHQEKSVHEKIEA
ncbi:hypothetical protein EY809_17500, partial [Salmonella enterica subsp. enterica serovar Hadar]